MSEERLQLSVCTYLRLQYPKVIFKSELTGQNTNVVRGKLNKQLRSHRGFPDLEIYEPRNGYHGLFIELKKRGARIRNKYGLPANKHIEEQVDMLIMLQEKGYQTHMAIGFDDAKKKIDDYLNFE